MKSRLLATACMIFVGAGAAPAFAQQQQVASAEDSGSSTMLTEVVITAERRTQSVQKSSLAIDVLSAQAVKEGGVSQMRDLTAVLPGVVIGQGGPATQIYIRGIGDFGSTPVTNPAVATYIDGVYVARANSIEGNFFDVSRVEAVKGPQGTLYGRNAAGGAVNILTNSPVLGETTGALNIELGNYSAVNVDGYFNVPLGENLALRAAAQVVDRKGYSSQGFDDDKKESGRLSLLWKPNDDVSLRVTGAYTHVGGQGPGYLFSTLNYPASVRAQLAQLSGPGVPAGGVQVPTDERLSVTDPRVWNMFWGVERLIAGQSLGGPGEVGPYNGLGAPPWCLPNFVATLARVNGAAQPLAPLNPGLCNALSNGRALPLPPGGAFVTWDPSLWSRFAGVDNRYWNINAQLDWDLGFANLTVIPGYRSTKNDYTTFPTGMFDNGGRSPETSKSGSLEARLAKDTSLVDWVLGVYAFKEKQTQNWGSAPGELQTGLLFNTYNPAKLQTTNYAVFGQGSWHLSDQLRLITGMRYSYEKKRNQGATYNVFPSISFLPGQPCFNGPADCLVDAYDGSITFKKINWKLGLEYDLTSRNMLFATAATGSKSGGLNGTSIGFPTDLTPIPYRPEKLTAYELGSRNRFLDGRLQVNLEAFYWLYRDHQDDATFTTPSGRFIGSTQNAGEATIYGGNVDIVAQVTDADVVRFNTEYNHTEYTDFTILTSGSIQGLTTDCKVSPAPGTPGLQFVDCSGFPLPRAPKWTGSMSWTHTFSFENGGSLDATASGQFSGERYLSNAYSGQVLGPDYFVVNLDATYHSPDDKWSISAFGRNLTDELVYTGSFGIRGLNQTIHAVNIGAPRTYGVRASVNF